MIMKKAACKKEAYNTFRDALISELRGRFPANDLITVHHKQLVANNGKTIDCLVIQNREAGISPSFHLSHFYSHYAEAGRVLDAADEIMSLYESVEEKYAIDFSFLSDYDWASHRITCRLVNYARNARQLHDLPCIRYLDLAVVFRVLMEENDAYCSSFLVENSHIARWESTPQKCFSDAISNTPALLPYIFIPLGHVADLSGPEEYTIDTLPESDDPDSPADGIFILTNNKKHHGAGTILYENLLRQFTEKRQMERCYIIPSSIHEVILIPEHYPLPQESLRHMVREGTGQLPCKEDFLSQNLYQYDRAKNAISVI